MATKIFCKKLNSSKDFDVDYMERKPIGKRLLETLTQKIAGSKIFSIKPLRYDTGTPIYSINDLGELANKVFPVAITNQGYWSNDPKHVKSTMTMLNGRFRPTHEIFFSPTSDIGEYRFDVE